MAIFTLRPGQTLGSIMFSDGSSVTVIPGQAFVVPDQFVKDMMSEPGIVPLVPPDTGTTAQRPTGSVPVGSLYWDSSLQKPIWFAGASVWKDATGTAA